MGSRRRQPSAAERSGEECARVGHENGGRLRVGCVARASERVRRASGAALHRVRYREGSNVREEGPLATLRRILFGLFLEMHFLHFYPTNLNSSHILLFGDNFCGDL